MLRCLVTVSLEARGHTLLAKMSLDTMSERLRRFKASKKKRNSFDNSRLVRDFCCAFHMHAFNSFDIPENMISKLIIICLICTYALSILVSETPLH